ncbi:unnamed protein product, partial [Ascophyllum nodosum]
SVRPTVLAYWSSLISSRPTCLLWGKRNVSPQLSSSKGLLELEPPLPPALSPRGASVYGPLSLCPCRFTLFRLISIRSILRFVLFCFVLFRFVGVLCLLLRYIFGWRVRSSGKAK